LGSETRPLESRRAKDFINDDVDLILLPFLSYDSLFLWNDPFPLTFDTIESAALPGSSPAARTQLGRLWHSDDASAAAHKAIVSCTNGRNPSSLTVTAALYRLCNGEVLFALASITS